MADNFNLRSFLTENKLTKNAKLLKEQEESYKYFEEEGNGGYYLNTVDGHKIYSMEDSSVMDTCFYAIIDPDGHEEFVGIDVSGEPISSEELQNEYELQSDIADFIEADINAELEDGLDEEATQGTDISGYWVMYGEPNKGLKQFIKMFPSEEEAQQALQDAPTTYGQHVLRGNWGIQSAQDWLASGKELGSDRIGHPDRVAPKRLSPEEKKAIRQLDFDAEMEREGVEKKKPVMETLTAKERRLVEMVNKALKEGYDIDKAEKVVGSDGVTRHIVPDEIPAIERMYNSDEYGDALAAAGTNEGDEMAQETVIPEYNTIDELMNSIDHGTNKVAEEHKMQEMKKIAEALRRKAKKMEESEHAAHISPKDLKQLATDAAKLEKAAEKLKAAFDKKFNKKEKPAAAPKAEKVEALQEGTFDLRKFLIENRK